MAKESKKAEKDIGAKMHKMKGEDRPQAQKVAIAMSEAREKGDKVPAKKGDPKKKDPKAKGGREKEMMKKDDHMKSDTEHEDSRDHEHLDYDSYKR